MAIITARKPRLAVDANGFAIQGTLRPWKTVAIGYTDTSATYTDTLVGVEVVRVYSTTDCFINLGGDATNADVFVKAYTPELFNVAGLNLHAIRSAQSGTLYVTIMI